MGLNNVEGDFMTERKRIREWMEIPGRFSPGKLNSIADVPEVTVGHCSVIKGDNVRTGVTVISPIEGDIFATPVPAAIAVGNGFGKITGMAQVEELGELESLIGLTNTLSVPAVMQGLINHHVKTLPEGVNSINIVVGETNDSVLNDIMGCHVTPEHVAEAIIRALSADVAEGAVGAGSGTVCYGYKGGIGTASRVVPARVTGFGERDFCVGALVQSNFGGNLNVYGRRMPYRDLPGAAGQNQGSCMIVVATNAPLSCRQLGRAAKRGIVGMTNTGTVMGHGSGDFCIAFSNYRQNRRDRNAGAQNFLFLSDSLLSFFFEAVCEAVQEAVYNSLTMSGDTSGNGAFVKGFDVLDL